MNKEQTGKLIAEARKEKRMTQQELADRLHITSKAVSKWETGVSVPDIGLLVPLSEVLGLSVTELLEGQRAVMPGDRTPEQVEDIVKTAIAFSEDTPEKRRTISKKRVLILVGSLIIAMLEALLVSLLELPVVQEASSADSAPRVYILLGVIFCGYFMLRAPERLPSYYDDHEISGFLDGFFRINIPGVSFNNRNWPHILRFCRIWTVLAIVIPIPIFTAMSLLLPSRYYLDGQHIALALFLGSLFIPICVIAKKYK